MLSLRSRFAFPVFAALSLVGRARAATFTVDTTADTVDANVGDGQALDSTGHTSLRAAVQEANARPGPDTIILPAGTYTFTRAGQNEENSVTGDLDVNDGLTILGAGTRTTIIDCNMLDRAFHIREPNTGAITIQDLTIRNGIENQHGGGIQHQRTTVTLTLLRVAIENCIAQEDGGAIACNPAITAGPSLIMRECTISGCTAMNGRGGALNYRVNMGVASTLLIENCTFSGNTAVNTSGGGIAIQAPLSTMTIRNSTIANNRIQTTNNPGGGLFYVAGGSLTIQSCIFADNTNPATTAPDVATTGGAIGSVSNTLAETATAGSGITNGVNGNIVGMDPNLGTLGNNGGPTNTHSLGAGPAVDKGSNPGGLTTDQRGLPRSNGAALDMGAVERTTNLDPLNVLPAPQSTAQNTALVLSAANGNQLSINDDSPTVTVVLSVDAANGASLTLSTTAGLTFTQGDGTADASMTFQGSLGNVNTALNGLTYTPAAAFTGTDTLTISTTDGGGDVPAPGPRNDIDALAIGVGTGTPPPPAPQPPPPPAPTPPPSQPQTPSTPPSGGSGSGTTTTPPPFTGGGGGGGGCALGTRAAGGPPAALVLAALALLALRRRRARAG